MPAVFNGHFASIAILFNPTARALLNEPFQGLSLLGSLSFELTALLKRFFPRSCSDSRCFDVSLAFFSLGFAFIAFTHDSYPKWPISPGIRWQGLGISATPFRQRNRRKKKSIFFTIFITISFGKELARLLSRDWPLLLVYGQYPTHKD